MARRGSFTSLINQIARDSAKRERERIKRENARIREIEQAKKQELRLIAQTNKEKERARKEKIKSAEQANKEARQEHLKIRQEEADDLNIELTVKIKELQGILEETFEVDDTISFDILRINEDFPDFELPEDLKKEPVITTKEEFLSKIQEPSSMEKLIPGWEKRHQLYIEEQLKRFNEYEEKIKVFLEERNKKISTLQQEYSKERESFEKRKQQRNQEVIELENAYTNREPDALSSYCTMVLERSEYPEGFPQEFRVAFLPDPKELVVEYELPSKGIIPSVIEYKYTKTKDIVEGKPRKQSEIKDLYQDVISAVCLRTIHELFESDQGNNIDVIVFNGFVNEIDPATGKDIRPCIISVRTTKDKFLEINLAKIDKKACLRNLGAQVSPRPDELMAVKPIIEFDMVDKRFVEESDILSDLENRPNLIELTPFEFENLVNNLFDRIGFDAKSTQSSRDGGVDVVAFDPRPILGGKVVIQAKRYKNVVGVSAVRDLYGTMINEGANKGILVSTSHYGKDAYEFAKDKPIELIDGGGLLYLLEQNGVKAKIIFPED
ncbi:MAG: restriction endonuclease [Anaerolineales bacterium]|nr:restriction endonuclease [Anaerolineales bacterium]